MSPGKQRSYKRIKQRVFTKGVYSLVPVRDEDKYAILDWRNAQIEILRQQAPLTKEQQEIYFAKVIDPLFETETPKQFIFSFFENGKLIGYGGLVHIDWVEKSAEISFLTETSRNRDKTVFINDWVNYLSLIKEVAGSALNFKSIFTYAYDLRPNLYIALEQAGFKETKRIKDSVEINGELKDVVIHSYFLEPLEMRLASMSDVDLYYEWANDAGVRKYSFQQNAIQYDDHVRWFRSKLENPSFRFYLFLNSKKEFVGQVRINLAENETIIGISIDARHRGHGYGNKMLRMASAAYFQEKHAREITAYIKIENVASAAIFKKAGFLEKENLLVNNAQTQKLILQNEEF